MAGDGTGGGAFGIHLRTVTPPHVVLKQQTS
jgi:hypothetical protein